MSITVTVNGQSGPSVSATTGDVLNVSVGSSSTYAVTVTQAGTPGATGPAGPTGPAGSSTSTISQVIGLQAALDGKQAAGTYATLVGGLVPAAQLPSFVDDVLEYATVSAFPATGETGKIYVVTSGSDVNQVFRWSGSQYIQIVASPGSTDAVAEGSTNLYFTLARAAAAAPVQSVAGRTGDVVLSTADIDGLADALSNTSVDVVDGGDYVGVVVVPTPQITITAQPANFSGTVGTASAQAGTLPSGEWRASNLSFDGGSYWMTAYDALGGDYYAVSTDGVNWTKRYGLNRAGYWRAATHGDGKTVITGGAYPQVSTDGTTWSEITPPTSGKIYYANGKWFVYSGSGGGATTKSAWDALKLFSSSDLSTWSSGSELIKTYTSGSVNYNAKPVTLSNVLYFNSKYIAFFDHYKRVSVSSGGQVYWSGDPYIYTSSDGENWSVVENFGGVADFWTNDFARSVSNTTWPQWTRPQVVNGGLWVSSMSGSLSWPDKMAYSADGTTWVSRDVSTYGTLGAPLQVAYGNGMYVSVANGGVISTSTNGTTWTVRTPPSGWLAYSTDEANYVDGAFWIFGSNRTDALRSNNGIDWARVSGLTQFYGPYRVQNGSAFVSPNTANSPTQTVRLNLSGSAVQATFTASAFYASGSVTYQWQVSSDAGATWTNISGATSPTLSLSVTTADNGKRYRCVLSATGAATVNSNAAILTVT